MGAWECILGLHFVTKFENQYNVLPLIPFDKHKGVSHHKIHDSFGEDTPRHGHKFSSCT